MATRAFAIRRARELFKLHNITDYSFGFDRALNRFGQTNYTARRITISGATLSARTEFEIEQTLLHEIAHALEPFEGHSMRWLRTARRIGYVGGRCSERNENVKALVAQKARYKANCTKCGKQFTRQRAPEVNAVYGHSGCSGNIHF